MLVLAKSKEGFRLAVENGRPQAQDLAVYLNVSNLLWQLKGLWRPPNVSKSQKDLVLDWLKKHNSGTIEQIYESTLIRKKYIHKILAVLISEGYIEREGKQRTTLYYLPVPPVPQVEDEWNCQNSSTARDRSMSSTISRKTQKVDQGDQNCNGLLQPDHFSADQQEKTKKVELEPQPYSNVDTEGDVEVNLSSTHHSQVELDGQKVCRPIEKNVITTVNFGDVTNFLAHQSTDAESGTAQNSEEKRLVGVWHNREGYVHVVEKRGTRLTVRRPGEQITQTIYLRACDSRREYETHCEF